jgi:AraC-like DNA-binding protein
VAAVSDRTFEILYEDNHCLAVSKPSGVLSTHYQGREETVDRAVKAYLKEKYHKPGNVFVGIVHRLDRPVSGVLLLARTSKAAARLAAAVRYIREHACEGITVPEVLKRVPLRRIELERQFRKYLGHSPQAEIRAVQLKRIKQLLAETDLPLKQIARLAGYKHSEYMNVVFKRLTGQTPGRYRRLVKK